MSQANKFRVYALTGSVAAITATGAWYGAGLKTRHEIKQEKKQILESTTADKITQLERMRGRLVKERNDMAAKIERLLASSSPSAAAGGSAAPSEKSSSSAAS